MVFVLSGGVPSTVSIPDTEEVTGSIPVSPTSTKRPLTCDSLRAGFVTYAHLRGASDRAIAHQTRHRSLTTLGTYAGVQQAWTDNAVTALGL